MELKVVSWNVDGWHTIRPEQLDLLDTTGADIALLQEVRPASMELLRRTGWTGATALELVADGHTERGDVPPRFSCAVLVRGEIEVLSTSLVSEAPSAVRALTARLRLAGRDVLAVSAALPPGSMWSPSRVLPRRVGGRQAIDEVGDLLDWMEVGRGSVADPRPCLVVAFSAARGGAGGPRRSGSRRRP